MKKMKKVPFLVVMLLVVTLVLTACQPTPAEEATPAEAVDTIKIGALYPLTGPDAGWAGEPYIKSHQLAIDKINAAGGIACLGGAKLELVNGDTKGSAEAGNSEMERLITKEGVLVVFGSALSGTTVPSSQISEKYEVPYIVPNSLDGRVTSQGLKYVFQTVSLMQDWGVYDVTWAEEHGAETAVITVPNFSFGTEVEEIWDGALENSSIELLESFTYEGSAQDFTDTILRVKQLDPDVWFLLGNNQSPQLVKQAKEQGYYPKMGIITLGSGFATSFFLEEAGAALAEGIFFTMDFAPVSQLAV
ncbi:MAG: ABC transporter substrate-binding protein, partial [Deltaproteobacteria bacterium]|nr:ABC transporter substrate-binding protein [Deltaproteobacteria bacterium]